MAAAVNGASECIRTLLGEGLPTDALDQLGRTALHYASANGAVDCAKLLCAANCALLFDATGKLFVVSGCSLILLMLCCVCLYIGRLALDYALSAAVFDVLLARHAQTLNTLRASSATAAHAHPLLAAAAAGDIDRLNVAVTELRSTAVQQQQLSDSELFLLYGSALVVCTNQSCLRVLALSVAAALGFMSRTGVPYAHSGSNTPRTPPPPPPLRPTPPPTPPTGARLPVSGSNSPAMRAVGLPPPPPGTPSSPSLRDRTFSPPRSRPGTGDTPLRAVPPPPSPLSIRTPLSLSTAAESAAVSVSVPVSKRGLSPMHVACAVNYAAAVTALLAVGVGASDAWACGVTPLHVAAAVGAAECCTALLDAGVDVRGSDAWQRYVFVYCCFVCLLITCVCFCNQDAGATVPSQRQRPHSVAARRTETRRGRPCTAAE